MSAPPAVGPGKYTYIASVGRGGMADLYLVSARGPAGFSKLMVIKELRPDLARSQEHVEMFLDEARLAARLDHPQIVQTYDVAELGKRYFLVMEYLEGQALHHVLSRLERNRADVRCLYLRAITQVLSGLHHAHELKDYDGRPLGIVHRDVSPHNVFVLYSGHVKLVDFGVAKAAIGSVDTRVGMVKGKLAYMAPEQAMSLSVDRRADIYSCGVMLWEALAGRRLWQRQDDITIIRRLISGEIPKLGESAPETPAALLAICDKALSQEPDARYSTAEEMRRDLSDATRRLGLESSTSAVAEIMGASFELERSELARLVHEHMDDAKNSERDVMLTELSNRRSSMPAASRSPGVSASGRSASDSTRSTVQFPTTLPKERAGRSKRVTAALVAGAVAILAAGVLMFAARGTNHAVVAEPAPPVFEARSAPAPTGASTSGPSHCNSSNKPTVELTGEIDSDATLHCDRNYLLRFNVFVVPGTTLTIEPGTTLLGDPTTHAALVVQPGARIIARGTETAAIVFTSAEPAGERKPGDWGGLVLLGRAPLNLSDEHGKKLRGQVEGLTFGGEYGGDAPNDDSGVLEYVRIEYSGNELAPGNELNGLTLAGVGNGTTIDHVQVRQASDDCFEFFGGTVDVKHLICQSSGDDGFDWDYGYTGRMQFLLLQQGGAAHGADHGVEGDNDPNGTRNEPRSSPQIYNATLCGKRDESAEESYGLLLRRGTRVELVNSIVTGFSAGLDLRDRGTEAVIASSVFGGNVRHAVAYPERTDQPGSMRDDDFGVDELALFRADPKNTTQAPGLFDCFNSERPNFAPRDPLSLAARTPPADGFFDPAGYVGAVRDADDRWYTGEWTRWSER